MPTYVYRVTKYDPGHRDEHGRYTGPEDTASDRGAVEAAYLRAVAAFAEDSGVDRPVVREPQVPSLAHFGVEPPVDGFGLTGLFPSGRDGAPEESPECRPGGSTAVLPAGFHDGAEVSLDVGLELVRSMLRDSGAWCRLEVEDRFAVHVGWDQYLYVGSDRPCERALAQTRRLGLFAERLDSSPYAVETDGEQVRRPADDAFWSGLRRMVSACRAGVLEEMYVEGASRWHRLTRDGVDAVRARIAPRARLAVWPDLSSDVEAVLGALPAEGTVECVWQDADGDVRSVLADEDCFPALTARLSGAAAVALLPLTADERVPLFTGVMPDADGVLRARWGAEPTPSDRDWALLRTLRPGQIVTGTVTHIASFGVTFVDIGGFEAMINIPELSWRRFEHPSDVVSVGEEIVAEILGVEFLPERVSLSLKSLHEDPMRLLTGQIGRTLVGPVTRVVPFGVFVRVEDAEDGFEGLVHIAELADEHLAGPEIALRAGDALPVRIMDVDLPRRRIVLSNRQAVARG
ncbi:S1 RNA-binding domain-containing protein [Streptomyces sp. SID14515]|uniref:S1 RNA-binding domain-containing protein n=1 Tax=Streptomyces sp. SID14515 TaxID=2706074 RepID=UPI0013C54CC0|nr:S1 RNA-binding domain-containing protein [Streptomyces sp. SID14515]NEB37719.1 S1 RNA-binding domain-containing protein [Streptomyces sp. SID14515]